MAIETILANYAGSVLGGYIHKWRERRMEAQIRAMPYAEKRKAVEASQRAYIERMRPRITWRYRLGFWLARITSSSTPKQPPR